LRLANLQCNNIGVSFPKALPEVPSVGEVLRLHGAAGALEAFMRDGFLNSLRGHVEVGTVSKVPTAVRHRFVKRTQVKSSPERLRRRQMKRHGLTEEEAKARIPDSAAETSSLPFVTIYSVSTGQRFNVFLSQIDAESQQVGAFNAYGLSLTATVPWF